MKAFTVLFLGFSFFSPLFAGDIRTIKGRSIDLQPIHDWRAAKGSLESRPLKHWKEIRVLEIQQAFSTSMHIVKASIEGATQVITLRNMPRDLSTKLTRLQTLKTQVVSAQRYTERAKAGETAAKTRASQNVYVSGDSSYAERVAEDALRRADDAAAATANAQLATANLAALKEEIATLTTEVGAITILAMPTGGSYAGKAEWDTGLKQ